jgi:TPR repeat protein
MTQGKSSLGDLAFRAEGGDAGAQYRLGVIFLLGEVAEQDTEAAYRWLVRAAVSGNESAGALVEKLVAGNLVSFAETKNPGAGNARGGQTVQIILRDGLVFCHRAMGCILRHAYAWTRMVWSRDFRRGFFGTRFQAKAEPLPAAAHGDQAVPFQHPS